MEDRESSQNSLNQDDSTAGYSLGGACASVPPILMVEIKAGTEIDDFQILDPIGPGGCGMVYRAKQKSISRKVAFKVIHRGQYTQAIIERFNLERKTLGSLNHPNIVSIYGGGEYNGQPYFAMELVDGLPITKYADKNRLSIVDRVKLFLQVLEAVEFAHENGVIHRDIKPSNILVAEKSDGEHLVKVIDFGIAKIVNDGLPLAYATQTGQPIGTPGYMSPEQLGDGDNPIDCGTDIYSLGVLLHELLIGCLPFSPEVLSNQELDAVFSREPESVLLKFNRLNKDEQDRVAFLRNSDSSSFREIIQGDLNQIVIKCLKPIRDFRYLTVRQLIQEILNEKTAEKWEINTPQPVSEKTKIGIHILPDEIIYLNEPQWLVTNKRIVSDTIGYSMSEVRSVEMVDNFSLAIIGYWINRLLMLFGLVCMLVVFYHGIMAKMSEFEVFVLGLIYYAPSWLMGWVLKKLLTCKVQLKIKFVSGTYTLMTSYLRPLSFTGEEVKTHHKNVNIMRSLCLAINQGIISK
jgi:serine/threonine protein kinase